MCIHNKELERARWVSFQFNLNSYFTVSNESVPNVLTCSYVQCAILHNQIFFCLEHLALAFLVSISKLNHQIDRVTWDSDNFETF